MSDSEKYRVNRFKKDVIQENILEIMNETLVEKESELIKGFITPKLPIIFIVGAQRSGTTILMQLMSQYFELSYANNFIAKYWKVPYIGANIFKSISKNELNEIFDVSSELGFTQGLNGPHEFGYFWKRWFPWKSWEEKKTLDYSILRKQLAAWESVNNTPLIFKNIIDVSFNISKLAALFPTAFFIHIKRKPEFVIQSTFLSRLKLYNDENMWIGLEPPQYKKIVNLGVFEQICAQVYFSRQSIDDSLSNLKKQSLYINYEDLVKNTEGVLKKIKERVGLNVRNTNIPTLKNTNRVKISDSQFEEIQKYCNIYFKN